MRHCRRTDFALFRFLLEVCKRNVGPNVAVHVDECRTDADKGVEYLRNIVIIVDLRSPDERFGAEAFRNEFFRRAQPVHIGFCRDMGVPVARSATEFALDFDLLKDVEFASETCREIDEFLADSGRSRRLTVCAGHHRDCFVSFGKRLYLPEKFAEKIAGDLLSFLYHQSV